MEIRGDYSPRAFLPGYAHPPPPPAPGPEEERIKLSKALTVRQQSSPPENGGTQLVSETLEELEKGIRRTQIFERADGRRFTRIEELVTTPRGTQRNVIQQNPSGNTTFLEDNLERTHNGLFQRILRFTDEAGEQSTKIETGIRPSDPFTLSGGVLPNHRPGPFESLRGKHLDLQA
ncbi:MAG: hypothetical protein H6853_00395 [Rhodospirillales bacterium]|nr:hypothetical protein [Alphaproteobacteria bacterium]USO03785.1 MAG: hypothetical protein H6853_00395 [Rhodospirillales bacterium]